MLLYIKLKYVFYTETVKLLAKAGETRRGSSIRGGARKV